MSGSGLTLEALAADIQARSEAGDRDRKRSDDHYKAAGLHLVEARERVKKLKLPWAPWVRENLPLIAISRSYELIAIGELRKTQDQINAESLARTVASKKCLPKGGQSSDDRTPEQKTIDKELQSLIKASSYDRREALIHHIKETNCGS